MFRTVENLTDEDRSADTTRIAEELNQFRGGSAARRGDPGSRVGRWPLAQLRLQASDLVVEPCAQPLLHLRVAVADLITELLSMPPQLVAAQVTFDRLGNIAS